MKRTVAVIFFILAVFSAYAVGVSSGFEAGADYNMIIAGRGYRNYAYSGKFGIAATVPVLIEFTPSLSIETGLSYYMKDYGYSRTAVDDQKEVMTLDYGCFNHFLELPLAFRYTLALQDGGLSLFASAGGFIGLWIYGSRSGYAYSVSVEPALTPFSGKTELGNYNIFHAGVSASLGLKWKFKEGMDGSLRAGYSLTLTDLNKAQRRGAYPVHNTTVSLTGAVMWRFN